MGHPTDRIFWDKIFFEANCATDSLDLTLDFSLLLTKMFFNFSEGSNLTPAHHCSDFRFKTYAPVAFRYFRELFGIQADDFLVRIYVFFLFIFCLLKK